MNLTPEQQKQVMQASSVEELISLAKENGFAVTEEQANAFFAKLRKNGAVSDEELENVSGGDCDFRPSPDPKFNPGEMVNVRRYPDVNPVIIMKTLDFNRTIWEWFYEVYDTVTQEVIKANEGAMFRG